MCFLQPDREDEYARIENAGGKVIQWQGARVFGVLAMSRSLGNQCFSLLSLMLLLISSMAHPKHYYAFKKH